MQVPEPLPVVVDGLIYDIYPGGGVALLHREVIKRAAALDATVSYQLLTSGQLIPGIENGPNIRYTTVRPPLDRWLRPRRIFFTFTYLFSPLIKSLFAARSQSAIWHSTYYSRIARWPGSIVTTAYDMAHEQLPDLFNSPSDRAFRREKQAALREADLIICISRATADAVSSMLEISPEKLRVVPLAASEIFYQATDAYQGFSSLGPYLLYVGDRRHYKNFGLLLEAFASWRMRSEFRLVVVGRAWSRRELDSLRRLRIETSVINVTDADDAQLQTLYRHAAAFIYPSLTEGFGIPILEAAACGCPLVASDIPSSRELASDFGFFFRPQDGDSLLAALENALESGKDTGRVYRARAVAEAYSWDNTARATIAVYRELAGKGELIMRGSHYESSSSSPSDWAADRLFGRP